MTAIPPSSVPERPVEFLTHGVLLFVQFGFGMFQVFGKYVLGHMTSWQLAGFRVAFAIPVLLSMAWYVDRTWPKLRDLPSLAMLGFFGVFANQLLFLHGLHYTTATETGILMTTIPVAAAAVAWILGIEGMWRLKAVGIGLAVVGSASIMFNPMGIANPLEHLYGNTFIVLNCLCYGSFLVLQKPVLRRLPPLTVIAWAFVCGGTGILLVTGRELVSIEAATVPTSAWMALGFILLVPTALNYALNTWALGRAPSSLVATYTTLQPVIAAVGAAIFLGESAGMREAIGFVFIVAGLFCVSRPRPAEPTPAPVEEAETPA